MPEGVEAPEQSQAETEALRFQQLKQNIPNLQLQPTRANMSLGH